MTYTQILDSRALVLFDRSKKKGVEWFIISAWTVILDNEWGTWGNKSYFNGICNENAMEG